MNVYEIFGLGWASDKERHWRRFELYECFLVYKMLTNVKLIKMLKQEDVRHRWQSR